MCRPVGTQFGKLMAPLSGSHKGISFSSQIQPSTRACDLASRTAFAYPPPSLGALTEREHSLPNQTHAPEPGSPGGSGKARKRPEG